MYCGFSETTLLSCVSIKFYIYLCKSVKISSWGLLTKFSLTKKLGERFKKVFMNDQTNSELRRGVTNDHHHYLKVNQQRGI